jgi:hypothetical protein
LGLAGKEETEERKRMDGDGGEERVEINFAVEDGKDSGVWVRAK